MIPQVIHRSMHNIYSEGPLNTSDRISRRGQVRALEDIPTYNTTQHVPMISPLSSVHIPVEDPYKGITDEQIMDVIPCGISLGSSGMGLRTVSRRWTMIESQNAMPLR